MAAIITPVQVLEVMKAILAISTVSNTNSLHASWQCALRYHWPLSKVPTDCDVCGTQFTVQHAVDCKKVVRSSNDMRCEMPWVI